MAETEIKLRHYYGSSYFGSGAAWGNVNCSTNCLEVGLKRNGFIASSEGVQVIDPSKPARFYARGGDSIGRDFEGRSWSESGEYVPGEGWQQAQGHQLPDKAARQAWLLALEKDTEPAG